MRMTFFAVIVSTTVGFVHLLSAEVPTSVSRGLCCGQVSGPITHHKQFPVEVRIALAHVFQQRNLAIADPEEPFQQTDFVVAKPGQGKLETRRLLFAFRISNQFVVYYESVSAGLGANALIFSLHGTNTKLLWGGVEVDHDKLAKSPAELKQRICKDQLISDRAFFW